MLNSSDNSPLVSIITPVYNGSSFINKCFECIKLQTYPAIEWVVINDGSIDTSLEILIQLQQLNQNIKIVDQVNAGAAEARRNGANEASGDYVVYLDIDDSLSPNAIESAMLKFGDNIDFVMFTKKIISNNQQTDHPVFTDTWPQTGIAVFESCIDGWGAHSFGIYKKALFLSCYQYLDDFPTVDKTYKDELLTRIIFSQCRYINYCEGIYYYDLNDASVSKKFNPIYFEISNNAYSLEFFIKDKNLNISIERLYARLFFDVLGRFGHWQKQLKNKRQWLSELGLLARKISLTTDFQRCVTHRKYVQILPRIVLITFFKLMAICGLI